MTSTNEKLEHGSVTSPKGFKAAGICAGIKSGGELDLGILVSQVRCPTAAVFTQNQVKGASLQITQEHLADAYAQAVIVNSANANACTGERGLLDAREISRQLARHLQIPTQDVLPSSTGVIGEYLPLPKIREAIEQAVPALHEEGGEEMARAIMTTDQVPKQSARRVTVNGHCFTLGGIAKGSGMIHPNMATMLAYLTTDARIPGESLSIFLRDAVEQSFNRLSIDGDTSCCDTVLLMANGLADSTEIVPGNDPAAAAFQTALQDLCLDLTRQIAMDGEGVTKMATIHVDGALTQQDARTVAQSIAKSPLVKTALHGCDPNWGRIINAAGYSGVKFDLAKVDLWIGDVLMMRHGERMDYNESEAYQVMQGNDYKIKLDLGQGEAHYWCITTDFSQTYIDINADYRHRT